MYIQKIKIENFKSIYDPVIFDFENINGFWKISGLVGSGKTTIGEAIIYGLFGSVGGKNNTDLISWGRKHGSIEVWCVSKGRSIYIKRELNSYGQSPIYVEVDGEELVFTNKRDAQLQLEQEYYDTSKVTLELLCIISFNNFKSLATLNTADIKKFLDQVLGFYTLTEYADTCKILKQANLSNINQINTSIGKLESQVNKLEELSNVEIIEGDITEVKKIISDKNKLIKELDNKYKDYINTKNKEKKEIELKQASIAALGKNKKKEIDLIQKGTCPTCGSKIDSSQLEIKQKERSILLESYQELNKQIKSITEEVSNYNIIYRKDKIPIEKEIESNKSLLSQLEMQSKRLNINKEEIQSIKKEIQKNNNDLIQYQQEDNEWEQLFNILSIQVRAKILQSFIPALNKNITKYSQRLHLPYIVQFDHNFKCNISLLGIDQDIPISSLSTGQLKTVDMVIILGVLGTIIGSNGINILFLDELFSNLDANLRNEMCSVLRESLKPNHTIFIISHTELDDKYFDGNIHMKLEASDQYEKHSKINIQKFDKDY